MNCAELFVKCLEREGVEYIFGLPGEENAHFMMALEDSPIKFIMTRHEQSASFMAEAYGKLTHGVGVCLGTLGPGATNLVSGVASANSDRAPLVAITGQSDIHHQHKESHQYIDAVSMFKPITKWAKAIIHPDNTPEMVRNAFKLAIREKPGACHLELPNDVAAMSVTEKPVNANYLRRSVADDKIVDLAMAVIRSAKNPIILAGNGAIRTRASKQLRIFSANTNIGVISTFMGKGCVSRHSPQSLFTMGLRTRNLANSTIDAADVVITMGYDLVEYHPYLWNGNQDKRIVHIDFQPAVVDHHYELEAEVIGDIAHTIWMMNHRLVDEPMHFESIEQAKTRQMMLELFAGHKDDSGEGLIAPQKIIWDTREALGPNDILLSDVGSHKMWVAQYYHCDEPNTCIIPNGFCSMGCALPAAIAAKLVHPEQNIVAICGDGGFMMNVQELEAAVRLKTNIIAMVWVDNGFNLIEWNQRKNFGKSTDLSFGNPDFVKLAQSFGCLGIRVERAEDLALALKEALSADRPVVMAVPVDYRENDRLSDLLPIH